MKQISKAVLQAQLEMSNAVKSSSNPFFKSKFADLNAVREACLPSLNKHGISVLQPVVHLDGKNFVKTMLLHESGESIESLTEIVCNKPNDAQAFGSGVSYARRYSLQSMCCIGADDDDGNKASDPRPVITAKSPELAKIKQALGNGYSIADISKKYSLSTDAMEALNK
jgi:hypothetical protein